MVDAGQERVTAKLLLGTLEEKYGHSHNIMREVTVEDIIAVNRSRAYYRDRFPKRYNDEYWAKKGIDPASIGDADGYKPGDEIPYRRIDALMVGSRDGSGHHQRTAVEVKISRADFRRDTPEKVRAWRATAHRFIYLVPENLITPDEVPDGVGLWYWHPPTETDLRPGRGRRKRSGSITIAKKAKVNRDVPDQMPEGFIAYLTGRVARAEAELRKLKK